MHTIQFDSKQPNWVLGTLEKGTLFDEIQLLQLGETDNQDFSATKWDPPRPSAMIFFPTKEEPDLMYKFTSISLFFSPDLTVIERQTYSLLDYLGDVGGLHDMLALISAFLVGPIAAFYLRVELLSSLFNFRPS